jgi:hypothetical protein
MRNPLAFFGLVALVLAPACASSSDESPPGPPPADVEIGPEGGQLVDDGRNGFPGFALQIPPGALASKVRVSFAGAIDPTALPPDAERVGPQVKIRPEGTTLAKPARLTLPMDHALRVHFDNPPEDCKVWIRDGGGWKKIDPVATTRDSITIEVSSFGLVAAAGVFASPLPTCATCAGARSVVEGPCTSPSGYCIETLPNPASPNNVASFGSEAMAVVGTKLHYLDVDINAALTPVSYEIYGTHAVTRYPTHNADIKGSTSFSQLAVAANGDAWIAVSGVGTLRYPRQGLVDIFDVPGAENGGLTRPESVVAFTDVNGVERVVRFTSNMSFVTLIRTFFSKLGGASQPMFLGSNSEKFSAIAHGITFLGRSNKAGFCFGVGPTPPPTACTPNDAIANLPEYGEFTSANIDRFSRFALAAPASTPNAARYLVSGEIPVAISFPHSVRDMAIGDDKLLYAINTSRPEIMIADAENPGSVRLLPLTSLPASDPGYSAFTPRRIMRIAGRNELLVVTRGDGGSNAGLHRIRRAE